MCEGCGLFQGGGGICGGLGGRVGVREEVEDVGGVHLGVDAGECREAD